MQGSLTHSVLSRHSTRKFLPTTVPIEHVKESLSIAQHSPSNSNIQPWRALFISGTELSSLKAALLKIADEEKPQIPPLPEAFRHYRSELGRDLFGKAMGIAREDMPARRAAELRNFNFFGAPLAGIIYMDQKLTHADSLSVGIWLQTLVLELTEKGLGTCIEGSVAGYPQVIRKELGIADDMVVLCGLAVGYSDPDSQINSMVSQRDSWENCVEIRQMYED
jgi:nitroreductase